MRDEYGDGSEHFYLILSKHFNLEVIEIPTRLMPMQRVARVNGKMCLHKYCDSHLARKNLDYLRPEMPVCKEK